MVYKQIMDDKISNNLSDVSYNLYELKGLITVLYNIIQEDDDLYKSGAYSICELMLQKTQEAESICTKLEHERYSKDKYSSRLRKSSS